MSDTAEAFWVAAPGRGEIRGAALPAPTDADVVVRALYSGISRGTEATVFLGRVPASERERMRAPFQEGDFPAPVKYGYASVGRIEHGPRSLTGRHVFVLHPHQTRYVVPAATVHVLPDTVPPARAVLAANMETAINGIWDAQPKAGDRITVIGAGVVGCLVAWLAARTAGCRVELVDVNPAKAAVAAALGVPFVLPDAATPDADLVIHASGTAAGLARALELAGFEAAIVEMSWFGDAIVPVALGGPFHAKRLTLRSSQVGHVAPGQRARWDTRRRMALALSLLATSTLDVLISGESAFHDLPDLMIRLTQDPGGTLCHRIHYPEP